jgi:hypothetical protein
MVRKAFRQILLAILTSQVICRAEIPLTTLVGKI